MPLTDRFDLPLSTHSAEAIALYVDAVDRVLSANAGAAPLLERALAADPDFVLADAALARVHQLEAQLGKAREAIARARARAGRVSPREARHIEVIGRAVDGAAPAAMALLREHIAEFPRDGLALSLALGVYGLFGFGGRRDFPEAQLALLEALAPHWPGDWWFETYLGWSRIETGAVAAGAALVERALAANPKNAYAAHARAHGYHEAGDPAGGAAFLAAWRPTYDRVSPLHCHISWHLALFELARGDAERARAIYLDSIRPSVVASPPMPTLADSASFLWRWRLYDAAPPLDAHWPEVDAHARRYFPHAGLAFADLHAAFAAAAVGDREAIAARTAELRRLDRDGRLPAGPVVAELCAAAGALAAGEPGEAARILETAQPDLPRVGGSHAQREVFEDSLAVAYLRSAQPARLAAFLRARLARRPSARDQAWLALATR